MLREKRPGDEGPRRKRKGEVAQRGRRNARPLVATLYALRDREVEQAVAPFNPRPLLQSLVDKDIVVRLKWGETEYKGRLISVDLYMNIQLSNTEEFVNGVSSGTLGQVLIRCNNVLWIGKAEEVEPKATKDTAMSG
ncbi:hypothetical protein CFE70_002222 [Pyrenophora teres f. teres 0-1]